MKKSAKKEQDSGVESGEEVVGKVSPENIADKPEIDGEDLDLTEKSVSDKENSTGDDDDAQDTEDNDVEKSSVENENEKMEKEIVDLKDALLRKTAEFENFRKRMLKEKSDAEKFALERFTQSLLPVLDNLGRALSATTGKESFDSLLEGVILTKDQFFGVLQQNGVSYIEAEGTLFDPSRHEALQMVETSDHPENTIIEEFEKGYAMHKRVIRPSKVIVAKKVAEPEEEKCPAETDTV